MFTLRFNTRDKYYYICNEKGLRVSRLSPSIKECSQTFKIAMPFPIRISEEGMRYSEILYEFRDIQEFKEKYHEELL